MMDRQQKIDRIIFATKYRSGNDSCNSVYIGGMQLCAAMTALGGAFGRDTFEDACAKASDRRLDAALAECEWVLDYADKHPVTVCECCGQIKPAKADAQA